MSDQEKAKAVEELRIAIQNAEQFGLVRTEDGSVITGAIATERGIMLVEDIPVLMMINLGVNK
ncbi:hypothetical protein [Vibrio metschnikovii]|uniref:hypothetical protein n=1 Tax=Vibrio metschnikovii TaxID=28172 RepID=UPI00165DAF2C|nr:hypothetical protein [Vibrio metschnikovii]